MVGWVTSATLAEKDSCMSCMCVRESKNSVLRWPHDITVHTLNYLVKVDIFTLQYIVEPVHAIQYFILFASGASDSNTMHTTDVSFVHNTPIPSLTLHCSFKIVDTKFSRSRSRQLSYRWYDSLLCATSLLMMYNATPRYHGCSDSSTVDHFTSMETLSRHFLVAAGTFSGKNLKKNNT